MKWLFIVVVIFAGCSKDEVEPDKACYAFHYKDSTVDITDTVHSYTLYLDSVKCDLTEQQAYEYHLQWNYFKTYYLNGDTIYRWYSCTYVKQ